MNTPNTPKKYEEYEKNDDKSPIRKIARNTDYKTSPISKTLIFETPPAPKFRPGSETLPAPKFRPGAPAPKALFREEITGTKNKQPKIKRTDSNDSDNSINSINSNDADKYYITNPPLGGGAMTKKRKYKNRKSKRKRNGKSKRNRKN